LDELDGGDFASWEFAVFCAGYVWRILGEDVCGAKEEAAFYRG